MSSQNSPHFSSLPPDHYHPSSTDTSLPAPPPYPSVFHLFPLLPPELQALVWELAFLQNTTFNTTLHRTTLLQNTGTLRAHVSPSIYSPLTLAPPHNLDSRSFWATPLAESKTAFWASTLAPLAQDGSDRDYGHIRLLTPCEESTQITFVSGIPQLLQTCHLSRLTTLRTFRQLLRSYRKPGFRTPWPDMLRALDHAITAYYHPHFDYFPYLPLALQSYIFRLAFLRNTTFASPSYVHALAVSEISHDQGHRDENASARLYSNATIQYTPHIEYHVAFAAERSMAFWRYDEPRSIRRPGTVCKSGSIRLELPDDISSNDIAHPPTQPPLGVAGVTVTRESGIPALLQTSRLARRTALETWRGVLEEFQIPGQRVPWPNELAALAWALHLMHYGKERRVGSHKRKAFLISEAGVDED